MGFRDFRCDLCGRDVEELEETGYLDFWERGDATFLALHQSCALKVAGAVRDACATGAATLVKP